MFPSGLFYHVAILWTAAFALWGAIPVLIDAWRHGIRRGIPGALFGSAYVATTMAIVLILLGCVVGAWSRVAEYAGGGDPNKAASFGILAATLLIVSGGWLAVRVAQRTRRPRAWIVFNLGLILCVTGWAVSA